MIRNCMFIWHDASSCIIFPLLVSFTGSVQIDQLAQWSSVSESRILIFMTAHTGRGGQSEGAQSVYLKCWPTFVRNGTLSNADLILHDNGDMDYDDLVTLMQAFPNPIKKIIKGVNPGYQRGALQSIDQALQGGWFDGYDWVIRVNPDVLILNETPLLAMMGREPTYRGIFANCNNFCEAPCSGQRVHTDFFAFRPDYIPKNAFSGWNWTNTTNAEDYATNIAFKDILAQHFEGWIIVRNVDQKCRVRSDVLWHGHDMSEECVLEDRNGMAIASSSLSGDDVIMKIGRAQFW